ncbi:restriction endonuclease subunit S [Vibrio breoganii]|uniref:restriction endonuclease subunit S n=1 Tax=Vibrio breoganii TaxID=553239 RepID=UPI000C8366A2|nr:restriction endonuclease subunit S [Vibrio breoganii]PMG07566.1 restriction endonuclease [Vibrio breoganii]PMJ45318.1 restriction endonuclease [Vibrio breoganii]PMK59432.1 restriction endonuclease [Vibrio breoganii]PMM79086.1 restriction endonuclease [Vibrio breoganii]PMO29231.1 restriction endonuclease [Vibrio breoganii]
MSSMVKLRDVATLINGRAYKKPELLDSGKYPVLRVGNFFSNRSWYYSDLELNEKHYCDEGDLLYAWSASFGPRIWEGGKVIYHYHIWKLELDVSKVDKKYLFHALAYDVEKIKQDQGTGSTMIHVTKTAMEEREIPLPPLAEQKRIAAILDKADAIRQKRKQAIEMADEFLRGVFLDMFGDPVTNPKDFPLGTIRDLIDTANYGTSGKASLTEGQYPVLRMGNITYKGGWDFSDLKYMDLIEKELPKYLVHKGDLLFNRTNSRELVGKTAVYENDEPMAFAGYLIRVRANSIGNNYYISGYLNSSHGKQVLTGMCKSIVGMANINAQELQNIKILLPPVELQTKYENLVKAIKTRVSKFSASDDSLTELFNALSQKAFTGEL